MYKIVRFNILGWVTTSWTYSTLCLIEIGILGVLYIVSHLPRPTNKVIGHNKWNTQYVDILIVWRDNVKILGRCAAIILFNGFELLNSHGDCCREEALKLKLPNYKALKRFRPYFLLYRSFCYPILRPSCLLVFRGMYKVFLRGPVGTVDTPYIRRDFRFQEV